MKDDCPEVYQYLVSNKDRLQNGRDVEDRSQWHLFGRTQAVKDVAKEKCAINVLVREVKDIKLVHVPSGAGVYSGLYILSDFSFEKISAALRCQDFKVDITICNRGNDPVAGVAVKFVMQNYAQNANNYFENMLGETANIQCKLIPCFQIFIVPEMLPYYNNRKEIAKWEHFTGHHAKKYQILSCDDGDQFYHTPKKTLFCLLSVPPSAAKTKAEYNSFFLRHPPRLSFSKTKIGTFSKMVVYNDYERFINQLVAYIHYDAPQAQNPESFANLVKIPFYSLRAACGAFSEEQSPKPDGWISCEQNRFNLNEKTHFIVRAAGRSMNPRIGDGDYCVFVWGGAAKIGDIVLVQQIPYDNEYGGCFTIKQYYSRNEFHPLNRNGYKPIIVSSKDSAGYKVVGTFCCVVSQFGVIKG